MGKLISFGNLFSSKKKQADHLKKDFSSTRVLLKLTQNSLDKAEQDTKSAWSMIPLSYLLDLASTSHLSKIQNFFDLPEKERLEKTYLIQDVLRLRRSLVAGIVKICAQQVDHGTLDLSTLNKTASFIEEFSFLSEQKPWDWMSFHENEYDFFLNLAMASQVSGYTYFLKKARRHYLNASLALNKNYWQIPTATKIYQHVFELIKKGKSIQAKYAVLDFFERNDDFILFQYKKEHRPQQNPPVQNPANYINDKYAGQLLRLTPADYMDLIEKAFIEDTSREDITSEATITGNVSGKAKIIARTRGTLAGLPVCAASFHYMDSKLKLIPKHIDGNQFEPGDCILEIEGPARSILSAERIALNFLSYLSGIATETAHTIQILNGTGIQLLDTRKTLPGYRVLSKYAVAISGGKNHRMNLSEMGMIKDNHIAQSGSLRNSIDLFFDRYPHNWLEVEIDEPEQLAEVLALPCPQVILLDNMPPQKLKKCTSLIEKFCTEKNVSILTEASGGYNKNNVTELMDTGVHFVSMGSLTNSVRPIDFGLDWTITTPPDQQD